MSSSEVPQAFRWRDRSLVLHLKRNFLFVNTFLWNVCIFVRFRAVKSPRNDSFFCQDSVKIGPNSTRTFSTLDWEVVILQPGVFHVFLLGLRGCSVQITRMSAWMKNYFL